MVYYVTIKVPSSPKSFLRKKCVLVEIGKLALICVDHTNSLLESLTLPTFFFTPTFEQLHCLNFLVTLFWVLRTMFLKFFQKNDCIPNFRFTLIVLNFKEIQHLSFECWFMKAEKQTRHPPSTKFIVQVSVKVLKLSALKSNFTKSKS